jgi:membrane protease YdiL (CAAX protease family)
VALIITWALIGLSTRDTSPYFAIGAVGLAASLVCVVVGGRGFVLGAGFSSRSALVGLAFGVVLVALSHAGYAVLSSTLDLRDAARELYHRAYVPPGPIAGLPFLIAAVVGEEVLFRGALFALVAERTGLAVACIASTTGYAIVEMGMGSVLLTAVAIALGMVLAIARALTGGVLIPLVAHAVWDVGILIAFPLEELWVIAQP